MERIANANVIWSNFVSQEHTSIACIAPAQLHQMRRAIHTHSHTYTTHTRNTDRTDATLNAFDGCVRVSATATVKLMLSFLACKFIYRDSFHCWISLLSHTQSTHHNTTISAFNSHTTFFGKIYSRVYFNRLVYQDIAREEVVQQQ